MLFVDNCMQKEAQRLSECLDISTKDSLIKILEAKLIGSYLGDMLRHPPELDEEALFTEEIKENDRESLSKYRTEFDTFMLEKRIEDL